MKKFLPIIFILLSSLFIAVLPTESEALIYEDTLRLHILANSDEDGDQALKLKVRDAILYEYSYELSSNDSISSAEATLSTLIPQIKELAERTVKDAGYDYEVDVSLGVEWFDTREYDDFTLPKGNYHSLIIKLGNAEGKNWWCVMFPPLCLDIATEKSPPQYTSEETKLIKSSKYNVKFKILELVSEAIDR